MVVCACTHLQEWEKSPIWFPLLWGERDRHMSSGCYSLQNRSCLSFFPLGTGVAWPGYEPGICLSLNRIRVLMVPLLVLQETGSLQAPWRGQSKFRTNLCMKKGFFGFFFFFKEILHVIKRNAVLLCAVTQMNLQNIMLSEWKKAVTNVWYHL